jgi:hypothetical protein
MALTQYTAPTNIIETLGLDPEDRTNLNDDTFRAKFDENAANIVEYINNTLTSELNEPIENMVPNTRTINGKALLTDIVLSLEDLGGFTFYGKYSQMSGGGALTGSAQNGIIPFSVEDNDDFNAINLATSYTKIVIPPGVSLAKFYWKGKIVFKPYLGHSATISLRKNGVDIETMLTLKVQTGDSSGDGNTEQLHGSVPIPCVPGDYFELYASLTSSGANSSSVVAGSKFGMEVLV